MARIELTVPGPKGDTGPAEIATVVDAKGDLIAATAADTVTRLPVGSAGQVLGVDASAGTGLAWRWNKWATQSTAYNVTTADEILDVTGTTTVTLPAVAASTGKTYVIRNTGTATVTIDGNGAELVGGAATQSLAGYGWMRIVSNGSAWLVLDGEYWSEAVGRRQFRWNPAVTSGAGGWQLTYGDTGWRNVAASLLNSYTAGTFWIRRVNWTVQLKIGDLTSAAATDVYTMPTGFRTNSSTARFTSARVYGGAAYPSRLYMGDTNGATISVAAYGGTSALANSDVTNAEVSWHTTDAWPTSLPGTASGSIPAS